MLNQSGIVKTSAATRKTMFYDTKLFFALSCKLSGSANAILRAGTPLKGDLTNRETPFTIAGKDEKAVGILEHDVVLDAHGKANGGIVVFGFIDESKLDTSVVSLLNVANTDNTKVRDTLKQITFCK